MRLGDGRHLVHGVSNPLGGIRAVHVFRGGAVFGGDVEWDVASSLRGVRFGASKEVRDADGFAEVRGGVVRVRVPNLAEVEDEIQEGRRGGVGVGFEVRDAERGRLLEQLLAATTKLKVAVMGLSGYVKSVGVVTHAAGLSDHDAVFCHVDLCFD